MSQHLAVPLLLLLFWDKEAQTGTHKNRNIFAQNHKHTKHTMSQAQGEHMSIVPQRKYTSILNAVFRIPSDIESTANDAAKNWDEEKNSSRIVPHHRWGRGWHPPPPPSWPIHYPQTCSFSSLFCWVACIVLLRWRRRVTHTVWETPSRRVLFLWGFFLSPTHYHLTSIDPTSEVPIIKDDFSQKKKKHFLAMERFRWIFFSAFWRRASNESGQFDPKKRDCKKGGPCPHLLLWRGVSEHKSGEQPLIRKEDRIHGMSALFQYKKEVQCAQKWGKIKHANQKHDFPNLLGDKYIYS